MADSRAREAIKRWQDLKAERGTLEQHWQEIAELCRPTRAHFTSTPVPGDRRGLQIFDNTAGVAGENLSAGLWSMVTNSANEWFRLKHRIDALDRDQNVKEYLDTATSVMRDVFAEGGQRFYTQALECYTDLCLFGTGIFYAAESSTPGNMHFEALSLAECMIAQNDESQIDTVIRRWEWTARQAHDHWNGQAGQAVAKAMADDKPGQKFWFLHVVEPNPAANPKRKASKFKAFRSLHIAETQMEVLQESGFDEFPYMVPRWSTTSRGLYGDSPAMLALPDIKTLQAQERTQLVAAQKAADPPLLAPDENAIRSIRTVPGGIIYGAVDGNGNPLVRALETRGAFQLTEVMTAQKREAIKTAFYAQMMILNAAPNATATEILARQEEQLRMMGPHLGRLTAEFHSPLIERVFGVLYRAGRIPQAPDVLRQAPALKVEYVSPLARAQKASEGAAILRTLEAVLPLSQVDPSVLMVFDLQETARGIAEAFGLPARMLRSPEDVAKMREEAAAAAEQQNKMMMLANAAPAAAQGAKAIKDLASVQTQGAA